MGSGSEKREATMPGRTRRILAEATGASVDRQNQRTATVGGLLSNVGVAIIIIVALFDALSAPLFGVNLPGIFAGAFTFQSLITFAGGAFIIYTAVKEITHLLSVEFIEHSEGGKPKTVLQATLLIVAMNLVFSFDSILSAMAIANEKSVDAAGGIVITYGDCDHCIRCRDGADGRYGRRFS